MSIFKKLFGTSQPNQKVEKSSMKVKKEKNRIQNIEKTSEALEEELFWKLVEASLQNTDNQEDQEQFLVTALEKLSPKEIIGFRLRTDRLLYDTYTSEMWCAGYIMNGGCSDDGFEYFRNWVISRGKEVYYRAKENPDSLIETFAQETDFYEFESFWYVALTAFEHKTGENLYDYIADDFKYCEGNYPQFEFNWEEEQPETMKAICPQLFEKIWNT